MEVLLYLLDCYVECCTKAGEKYEDFVPFHNQMVELALKHTNEMAGRSQRGD